MSSHVRNLLILMTCAIASLGASHGLTLCIGQVNYTADREVFLDMRLGVGILHKYVDPDDNAIIIEQEWTSSTKALQSLFASGLKLRQGDTVTTASDLKLNLTSGAEVQILATFDAPTSSPVVHFAAPVLRKFPGAPPAQLSLWRNQTMIRPPELLWFDKELEIDRSKLNP